jgi:hypothetical protein
MKTPLKTSLFACLLSLLPFVKAYSQPAWNTVYTENFNNVSSPDAVPNMYYGCSFAISGSGGNKYLRNSWAVEYCFVLFKLNLDAAYEYRMTWSARSNAPGRNVQFFYHTQAGIGGTDIGATTAINFSSSIFTDIGSEAFDVPQSGEYYIGIRPGLLNTGNVNAKVEFDDFRLERRERTVISFAQSALTVAEGGSVEVCVNASNPDPDGQAFVEVALATDAAPHLAGFTTQTLSFSGGAQTLQSCFTLQTAQPTGGEDDNYTYTLTLQNPSGGFNAGLGSPSTLTLTVLEANPGCPWAGEDRTICMGESVQIGCPRVGPTDPGANYCYKWLPEEGLEQPYNAITTATVDETTIYTVYISDNHGNLVATDEMTVFVEAKLSVTPVFPLICPGDTVILEATVEGSAENVFLWNTGEITSAITVTPHQTSFYTVEATSIDLGCTMKYKARVNVKYPPFIHISATSPAICHLALPALRGNQPIEEEKDNEYSCEYSSTWLYAGTGFPGFTYEWSTGETTPDIDVTVPGEYSVTVTKIGGCTTIDTVEIFPCYEVEIKPHVITSDLGDQYFLDAGEGYVSYIWHDGSTDRYIPVSSNVVSVVSG